jgi:hypothetical protein
MYFCYLFYTVECSHQPGSLSTKNVDQSLKNQIDGFWGKGMKEKQRVNYYCIPQVVSLILKWDQLSDLLDDKSQLLGYTFRLSGANLIPDEVNTNSSNRLINILVLKY